MKNNTLRIVVAALAVVLILCSLTGCEIKRYYTNNGITIRLPRSFEQTNYPNTVLYLHTDEAAVAIIPENTPSSSAQELISNYSASDYTRFVAATVEGSKVGNAGDIPFYEYEYTQGESSYYSMAFIFKEYSTFFKAQFECDAENKDEYREKFIAWAKTITFEERE